MNTPTERNKEKSSNKKDKNPPVSEKVHPMQQDLLKFFSSRKFDEKELIEIKRMISNYYAEKVDNAVDRIFEERGWDVDEKVKEWGTAHYRRKNKPE